VFKRLTRQAPPPEKAPDLQIDVAVTIEDLVKRTNPSVMLPDGKSVTVNLPEDARDGSTVRLEEMGHKLPNMKRGDVIATLRVAPHRWYRLDGHDIRTFLDIDIENAVLGCQTSIETPDGRVAVSVPEWSGSNATLRIEGYGLPKGGGKRGDLIVEIRVMLWDRPDQKVIDLMRSLRDGFYL
jgi:DnaJ-class molecular chaperone